MNEHAHAPIRSVAERTFHLIPIDTIDVVTSRNRGDEQFRENVRSIAENGLYKPILVNAIALASTGRYQLICGEGRLLAHRRLERTTIKAEVVHVDLATAHLMSLGENMTKSPPKTVEYAYALLDMHQRGTSIHELVRITGHSAQYVQRYINLVQRGEDRLIKGVEQRIFPLDFAMRVAESPDGAIQHVLMDAFDRKLISASHVETVRKILIEREQHGKDLGLEDGPAALNGYTVSDLKRDIARITKERERFNFAAESKETRVVRLVETFRRLAARPAFAALLAQHQIVGIPDLQGRYGT